MQRGGVELGRAHRTTLHSSYAKDMHSNDLTC
jgi:hypothetical protein